MSEMLSPDNLHDYFNITEVKRVSSVVMPVSQISYKLKLSKAISKSSPLESALFMSDIITAAFSSIVSSQSTGSTIQFILYSEKFIFKKHISTKRQTVENFDVSIITDKLELILQSDETLELHHLDIVLVVNDTAIENIGGGGAKTLSGSNNRVSFEIEKYLVNSKCLINPIFKNFEQISSLCLPMAIVVELEFISHGGGGNRAKIIKNRKTVDKVFEFIRLSTAIPAEGPFALSQVENFAKCLPSNIRLLIFDSNLEPLKDYGSITADNTIMLYIHYIKDSFHTYIITNLKAFFGYRHNICKLCYKGYEDVHRCVFSECKNCRYINCRI